MTQQFFFHLPASFGLAISLKKRGSVCVDARTLLAIRSV